MTAPTPSGGGMPQQPTAELQQQEQERQRERMPRVLRSYASAFDRGHVSDSDAGLYVRRAADEIDSLRAAILAARRDAERYKAALEDIANPILAIARDAEAEGKRVNGAMAVALAKDVGHLSGIARAALAATPEGVTNA